MARKMKASGIEWIGEIPEGWEITKIKYIVSSVTDIDHFMPDSAEFGIPYLMIGDLKDLSSSIDWDSSKKISIEDYKKLSIKSRPQIGDIIFARYASIGTTCYIDTDRDFLVSYACLTIHPSDLIIGKFLSYYLKSSSFAEDVLRRTNSNTQGNVGKDSLVNATIVLPSIIEQTQIVNFLDAKCSDINAMLSKTRASIEEYKKLKQAVITQAVTEGTPAMFSSPHSVKLKYLISIVSGEAIRNEQLSDFGEYPVYGGGEIIGFCSQYNTSEGSLIIGRVGARCGCVTHTTCKSWATDNALIVLPTCNAKYMYYVIGHCQLNNLNTSNAQPLITSTKIKNVVVPYFSDAMQQQEIADYLDAKCAEIDGLIAKKEQLVKELESYKKSLIYEVVTGKREV